MYIHPVVVLILAAVAVIFLVQWLGASALVTGLCAVIAVLLGGISLFLGNLQVWR